MVEDNTLIGVNADSMNQCISYLEERKNKISNIFKSYDNVIVDIQANNSSDNIGLLVNEYNVYRNNFNIVIDNIETYKSDLLKVLKSFELSDALRSSKVVFDKSIETL